MRLAGIEKGGFYPYQPHLAEATASWFIPPQNGTRGRLLDLCAGESEIASLLGNLLNFESLRVERQGKAWGCNLFPYRAEKAKVRMDRCHSTATLDDLRIPPANRWRSSAATRLGSTASGSTIHDGFA
jgi:hypothetical protein